MTANTWGPGGYWQTDIEILQKVAYDHVIITGGEPVIWNLDALIGPLKADGHTVQLETSGLNALKGNQEPDWVTWSPKQNINFQAPMSLKNIAKEVKFVIDQYIKPEDIQKVVDYYFYENNGLLRAFVLMPEGCPPGKESIAQTMLFMSTELVNWHGYDVRMGARLQYYLNMR
jgi:organic radical activating enzyme